MRRSEKRRRGWQHGWRRTPTTNAGPFPAPTSSTLAHGTAVETAIVARLFGAPVLRLEGTVLLAPAEFGHEPAVVVPGQVEPRLAVDPPSPAVEAGATGDVAAGGGAAGDVAAGLVEAEERLRATAARQARLG